MDVVGAAAEIPGLFHGRLAVQPLSPFDDEFRIAPVPKRKVLEEGIQGVTVHPVRDRGVDDPFTFGVHLGDSHMDEVEAVGVTGGAGDGGVH